MKEKVTSYEISKRLHELGFECESHCGWWGRYRYYKGVEYNERFPEVRSRENPGIKAYDCWDLLMWLRKRRQQLPVFYSLHDNIYRHDLEEEHFSVAEKYIEKEYSTGGASAAEPQNALGKAVIKILEEQNEKK